MSKVVHLSDDAHAKAKEYCRVRGYKMSDWVAALIDEAIDGGDEQVRPSTAEKPAETKVRSFVSKKKTLQRIDDGSEEADDGIPVYAKPPFWKRADNQS